MQTQSTASDLIASIIHRFAKAALQAETRMDLLNVELDHTKKRAEHLYGMNSRLKEDNENLTKENKELRAQLENSKVLMQEAKDFIASQSQVKKRGRPAAKK